MIEAVSSALARISKCRAHRKFSARHRVRSRNLGCVAGAPGFEPGNGGIKIRCLTTWLRPITRPSRHERADHTDACPPDQRRAVFKTAGQRAPESRPAAV